VEAARACTGVVTAIRPHVGRRGGVLTGGGCIEQEELRRGSPKRSSGSGVVGSGRRGGVPVEDDSGGVAASSRVVLRLEAEAREGCGRGIGAEKKTRCRGEKSRRRQQHPFKGGGTQRRGGGRESGDACSGAGEREWGPGCGCARLTGRPRGPASSDRVWGEHDSATWR
jgi:hypothetical protein